MSDFDSNRTSLDASRKRLLEILFTFKKRLGSQNALDAIRKRLLKAQAAVSGARQATARLEARRAAALRTQARGAVIEEFDAPLGKARADEAAKRARLTAVASVAAKRADTFAKFADPREAIAQWSDETPILLLPVRLETRFKSFKDAAGVRDELWVRIYPDECAIDTFEAALSETEVESGKRYWIETWAAGNLKTCNLKTQRRAAWRNLVASHGAGRAAWIVHEFEAAGAARADAAPAKAKAEDIALVIATEAPPSDEEQTALSVYWKAVWLAKGGLAGIEAAGEALANAPGVADAAQLIARFEPANLAVDPSPAKRTDVGVKVVWLHLPVVADVKTRSWTAPARVRVLPDRFVVLGYQGGKLVFQKAGEAIPSPLVAGPDPSSPADHQLRHDAAGELRVPAEMRWMVDFDAAVKVGMGIKVPLDRTPVDLDQPIEHVIAVGVRLADDVKQSSARLEELLMHHRYGRTGFAFVPQGTPTNNTDDAGAGYSRIEDADTAFDALYLDGDHLVPTSDWSDWWWQRRDGQWLADALGVDPNIFDRVPHANGTDLAEARAMNRALWPATFGYAMETMLHPVFGAEQVDATRWFYTHFVAGRGMLPSVRIGDQPYGVLPVSAISQWKWLADDRAVSVGGLRLPPGFIGYRHGLATLLAKMRGGWAELANRVSFVGKTGDAHQLLLDVLGLHPASVEFHQRYAESLKHIFNRAKLQGLGAQIFEHIGALGLQGEARDLLNKLGYTGKIEPDALSKFFFTRANRLNGPVDSPPSKAGATRASSEEKDRNYLAWLVDDRPPSETEATRAYTEEKDRNYLAWLVDAARNSFEDLRQERGFKDDRSPDALLYTMLRHALLLGYWDSSLRLHQAAGALTPDAVGLARGEPAFVHVDANRATSESRFETLYSTDARVTKGTNLNVAEHIRGVLGAEGTQGLADQLDALDLLKNAPTARLERCLVEHIDTASFRLDAWLLGLVHYQLASLRYRPTRDSRAVEIRRGIHLGAYGWLEDLKRNDESKPVVLKGELAKVFGGDAQPPLMRDPANGGYVFAPSINQATTAAILRAGYLANAASENPRALAVNLSSARVRVALGLIEGIRNGQPLGALLGYRLQRGLHEGHGPLELDRFLYPLREQFPLVANQLASTKEPGAAIETIEANNVVDGLKLIEHIRKPGNGAYPFNLTLPPANAAERAAIDSEVDSLLDAHDALADLALAEGVHQAVLGNYDSVAATLDAYAKGTFPPEPEVVRTPRSGFGLTHRIGLHFEAGVDSSVSPVAGVPLSPRSWAQAMVNKWLHDVLPDPDEVACLVRWFDPVANAMREETVTQRALELQPIDLLYIVTLDADPALSELDDRILRYVVGYAPRPDTAIAILHTARLPAPLKSFFEIAPLVRHLRSLLLRSRPLAPTDVALAGEADSRSDATQVIASARVQRIRETLDDLHEDLGAFNPAAMTVDDAIDTVVALFERSARFGLHQVGWGFLYEWRRSVFARLLGHVQEVVTRWDERLAQFDQRLADYNSLSGAMSIEDEERFAALGPLELLIAAMPATPRPANPAAYETALAARRQAFIGKLTQLKAVLTTSDPGLASLLADVRAAMPLTAFDNIPFAVEFTLPELRNALKTLTDRWTDRLAQFDAGLVVYGNLPPGTADPDRLIELEKLNLLVAARAVNPPPATPAEYLPALNATRTAFDAKLTQLKTQLASTEPRPEAFLAVLRGLMPLAAFDETPLSLDKVEADFEHAIADLRARVGALKVEIARRLKSADEHWQDHEAAADPGDRVRALQKAGSALLGEDMKMIPEFTFGAEQSAELVNAINASTSGALTEYLRTHADSEFPVDDWLHGIARVREKLHAWEQATVLAKAFGRPEATLVPIQLPYRAGEGWLAMEFDPATVLDGERLLYTAHFAGDPDAAAVTTCGVLLDEWTEIVPTRDETAGLTFHYDRPSSEPPQTWLLVTPAQMQGRWQWTDLVGALHETLELARLRAVEPAQVDTQAYARFLPATTSAVTLYGISISANYSHVNKERPATKKGGGDG